MNGCNKNKGEDDKGGREKKRRGETSMCQLSANHMGAGNKAIICASM